MSKKLFFIIESSGIQDDYYYNKLLPGLYNGVASGYLSKNKYDEALMFYNKALEILNEYKLNWAHNQLYIWWYCRSLSYQR